MIVEHFMFIHPYRAAASVHCSGRLLNCEHSMNIQYLEKNADDISMIEALWNKLNGLHSQLSPFFQDEYGNKKFADRKKELLEKAEEGILKIFIAMDADSGNLAGYCVCSVVDGTGEIDSIFVEEGYRKHKIGDELMTRSGTFFKNNSVSKQVLSVYAGNENVIRFYNRHGYYQKYIILEKKESN